MNSMNVNILQPLAATYPLSLTLSPAEQVDQPVDGGELAAQDLLSLLVADALDAADVVDGQHARGALGYNRLILIR